MKRKVLNGKLAVGLVAVIAILGVGIHLVHGMQVRRTAVSLRDQADKADKAGRVDQAKDYLSRYLSYRPNDVDALCRYAELIEKSEAGNRESREKVRGLYQKAVRFSPGRDATRRHLLELDLADGLYTEARIYADFLQAKSPNDAELMVLLGRCEEGTSHFSEAETSFRNAAKRDPTLVQAYTRLAELLRRQAQPDQADAVMDAKETKDGLIAHNPNSAAALLAHAAYGETYAIPEINVASDVAKALELAPEDAAVRLAAARVALSKNDVDGARQHLEYGVQHHPGVTAFYHALSDLETTAGHADKAEQWLRDGIKSLAADAGNERVILNWMLADLLIQNSKTDKADGVIETLKHEQVRPELLGYLEASSLVARGRHAAGAKRLEEVAPALAALPEFKGLAKRSWIALARCYDRLGNADQRLDAYRQAVAIDVDPDPLRITARFGLAASLVALDKIDEALDEYRRVPSNVGANIAIARLQILQNYRRPDEKRRWDEIGRTLDAVEQSLPGGREAERARAEISILRAEALAIQGRFDQARALLDKAVAKTSDQVELRVALANLLSRGTQPELALSTLDAAEKTLGDRAEFRQARAAYWARKGGDEAPAALAKLEQGAEKFNAESIAALRRDLAGAYESVGKPADADRLLKQLAQMRPDDLNIRLALFDLAMRSKNSAGATDAMTEIRRIEGEDGSYWRCARAIMLKEAFRAKPDDRKLLLDARVDLATVGARRPSWSRVPISLAEIELLDKQPNAAIREYIRALRMGDRTPSVIHEVARLLRKEQRFDEAQLVLNMLRETGAPLSGEMQKLAAQVAFRNQDFSGALARAQEVVSDKSDNYRDLIWLAQIRWGAGQPAEPILRRAIALAKDAPEARLALIAYLAGTGKKPEAEAALKAAAQELPREKPWSVLALAQGHQILGQTNQAKVLFTEALAANPNDLKTLRGVATFHLLNNNPAEAKPHLEKILELKEATTDTAWARRVLAAVVTGQGGYLRTVQALEILGLADQPEGGAPGREEDRSPEDFRTKARILALQPSRASRGEAVAILERLIDRGVAIPDDSFLLAQLYEAAGDWPKARARLQDLVGQRADNPNYLALYMRSLIRHYQINEAQRLLAKLEAIAPGKPVVREIQARLLVAGNQRERAVALLTEYARKDDSRLEVVAALCEELGLAAAAEQLYRQSVEKTGARRPVAILILAQFLGRQGRVTEALDLIDERAWTTLPAAQVSNVALSVLYGAGQSESVLYERLANRIQAAIQKDPSALPLQFDLANLRCLQGQFNDGEKIFREIAEKNSNLASPLNNLAWMLAMRGDKSGEALKLIDKAIALEGDRPELLDTRGIVRLVSGQADLASRDIEDAIAVEPTSDKYFHLAQVYLAVGKRNDAERALREAQTRGLSVGKLHPLEQGAFKQLVAEFPKTESPK